MAEITRIGPRETRDDMQSNQALLICAYDSREKFEENHLEGALALDEFDAQKDTIEKGRELIFYCA